jgi:5'-nucleotidase
MNKKIVYFDLDGVIFNFEKQLEMFVPDINTNKILYPTYDERSNKVDEILIKIPRFFLNLEPYEGAVEYVKKLSEIYEIFFLSAPMWETPESYMDKRISVEKHFGHEFAFKRLILTHRKDLAIGHYLVDDRLKYGADNFQGEHIHFGTPAYPDMKTVYNYLRTQDMLFRNDPNMQRITFTL